MATEVYEWVLSGTLAGEFVQTVQHVKVERSAITTTFAAAKAINEELWQSGTLGDLFCNMTPEVYSMTSSRCRRVSAGGGPTAIALAATFNTSVGQRGGGISSAQANPMIIWIPTTAPAKTGRLFIPGVGEEDIENMVIVPTLIEAIEEYITQYVDGGTLIGTGDTWKGCVFRRDTHNGDTIDAGYVSPLIGTQRRRLHPV